MEEQQNQEIDFLGCSAWAVENGTFALGMILMFSKTVDLMTAFAPGTILGYTGMEVFYGLAVGILIEGALFVMKLLLPRAKNVVDWLWTVVVVVTPFIISALAQVFDSFHVRSTLQSQPESMQMFVAWFVPSIPTVIMALLIGKTIFASIPASIMPAKFGGRLPKGEGGPVDVLTAIGGAKKVPGFVGRLLRSPKGMGKRPAPSAPPVSGHTPALCPVCHSELPFIEYGSKIGKNNKPAKWPVYEKCRNDKCKLGRKNLGLPPAIPPQGEA